MNGRRGGKTMALREAERRAREAGIPVFHMSPEDPLPHPSPLPRLHDPLLDPRIQRLADLLFSRRRR